MLISYCTYSVPFLFAKMLYDMTMKNEKSKEQDDYVSPESENFPLTYEGLLANKQFLI